MLVISTVSYTLSIMSVAGEQVTQDITDFSRGSYDILIRPPNARTELEQQLNLVEENYLGVGEGGISLTEWQEIKSHPEVEIAAKVAAIALFTPRERTWMISKDEDEAIYYELEYSTSDGLNTYINNDELFIYDFGSSFQEYPIFPSSNEIAHNYLGFDIASFDFPTTYHQVVAVEPEDESKLTNQNLSALSEGVFDDEAYEGGRFSVPIISLEDASIPISINLIMDSLAEVTTEELTAWQGEFISENPYLTLDEDPSRYFEIIDEYISEKRLHEVEVFEFTPEVNHSPFKQNLLFIDDNMELKLLEDRFQEGIGGAFDYHSQQIGYQLGPVVYEIKDDGNLFIQQTGTDSIYGSPIYRDIEDIKFYELDEFNQAINNEDFFGFIENGTFSIEEDTEVLASSPLGIYGREMPYLASDPSVQLHPSAVPGSFITTPAHGLISIDHAEQSKGETPIDAIRVKVAGLAGYNSAAATKIRSLAEEWESKGFTVDIVAGASLQDIAVDVEGLGKVVQPFTTLGAADTVLSSWNALQIALTLLYTLVAFTFVGFTFFNLLSDRVKDEQLLGRLGWSKKTIKYMRSKEWSYILGIPILFIILVFCLQGLINNQWLPLLLSIFVSLAFYLLFILASSLQNKKKKQVKKQGKTTTIQNIKFYRYNILTSCIQLFLTAIITCFLPFFILLNIENITQTRLGIYIHGEISGLFIVIIILLYVLSFITVYQSLSRMWKKRQTEIQLFLHLGWGKNKMRSYFLKEVLIWAGLSTSAGWIVSLLIMMFMFDITPIMLIASALGYMLILTIALLSSTFSLEKQQAKGGGRDAYLAS